MIKLEWGPVGGESTGEEQTTVLVPWDGRNSEWLEELLNSFPPGTPVVLARNDSKREMTIALNEALDVITTPYTFLCGADDLAGPDMLAKLESAIGDADGAYPRMELFGDREWSFRPPIWSKHILQWRNTCGVFLVRTDLLREVGWRDSIVEDWDLVNRIAKVGGRFERVTDAEYKYRQHSSSLSQRINRVAEEEQFSGEEQLKEILGDKLHRYPLEAVFFGQASAAQNYVRGQVPGEHLPGVATDLIWPHNFDADTSVWLYPGELSYRQAFDDEGIRGLFDLTILDADDNYLSTRMLRSFDRAGRKELAKHWKSDQPWHRRFAEEADAVFVSTPSLAEAYAGVNKNVHVLRNSVLEADWRRVRKPEEDGKIRIGWAAGRQHDPDADIVAEALRIIVKRHPEVEVTVVGVAPKWDFDHYREPFTPSLAAYRQKLASFDISIAPLKLSEMNHGKSDLKWLESSMAGASFVCTDYEPYNTVRHGVTGLKCKDRTEWEDSLESLVVDRSARARIVEAARDEILLTRTAEKIADEYRTAIQKVRTGMQVAA